VVVGAPPYTVGSMLRQSCSCTDISEGQHNEHSQQLRQRNARPVSQSSRFSGHSNATSSGFSNFKHSGSKQVRFGTHDYYSSDDISYDTATEPQHSSNKHFVPEAFLLLVDLWRTTASKVSDNVRTKHHKKRAHHPKKYSSSPRSFRSKVSSRSRRTDYEELDEESEGFLSGVVELQPMRSSVETQRAKGKGKGKAKGEGKKQQCYPAMNQKKMVPCDQTDLNLAVDSLQTVWKQVGMVGF
jgi:hypothetical protein